MFIEFYPFFSFILCTCFLCCFLGSGKRHYVN